MAAAIKGLFFTDKLRTVISGMAFLLLLGAIFAGWAFPRHDTPKVDSEMLDSLKEVTATMVRSANNLEQQTAASTLVINSLTNRLLVQEQNRNDLYNQQLQKYGLDMSWSDVGPPNSAGGDPGLFDPNGMLPQNHDFGSKQLPSDPSSADLDQYLQDPARFNQRAPHADTARVPGGDSIPTPK